MTVVLETNQRINKKQKQIKGDTHLFGFIGNSVGDGLLEALQILQEQSLIFKNCHRGFLQRFSRRLERPLVGFTFPL